MSDLDLIYPEKPKEQQKQPSKKVASIQSRKKPSKHATKKPRIHDTVVSRHQDAIIEKIRIALKEFGKEAATHRFTLEEKKALKKIVFSYNQMDISTSENEIARISINYVIEDYYINGENSILARAIKAINA